MGKWLSRVAEISEIPPGKVPTKPTKAPSVGFVGRSGKGIEEKTALSESAVAITKNVRKPDIHAADLSAADYEAAVVQVLQPAHKTAAEWQRSLFMEEAEDSTVASEAIDIAKKTLDGEVVDSPEAATIRIPAEALIGAGLSDDDYEAYEERAAIMEFDGELSRAAAERLARSTVDNACWVCGQAAWWTDRHGNDKCMVCHPKPVTGQVHPLERAARYELAARKQREERRMRRG